MILGASDQIICAAVALAALLTLAGKIRRGSQ
jgi:hypothetical protein